MPFHDAAGWCMTRFSLPPDCGPIRLLTISGSTRARSSNTALLGAVRLLAPAGVDVAEYAELARLPHFNPDDERDALPPLVATLRDMVGGSDGLLLSTPEYAHGLPGSFKNLLDWLVGSVTFPGMPVMVLAASGASVHAPASLREILRTMSAVLVPAADVTLEWRGRVPCADDIVAEPASAALLTTGLDVFLTRILGLRLRHPT
jgi:chromate reductase